MNMKKTFCFVLVFLIFVSRSFSATFMPISEKVAIENHLEDRLSKALKPVIGDGNFVVIVNVTLNPDMLKESYKESMNTKLKESKSIVRGRGEVLPGVPQKTAMSQGPEGSSTSKITESLISISPKLISRMSAVIVLDKKVNAGQIAVVKNIANLVLGINKSRGDSLQLQQVELNIVGEMASKKALSNLMSVENIIKFLAVFAAVAVLIVFILNRLGKISMSAVTHINQAGRKESHHMGGLSHLSPIHSPAAPATTQIISGGTSDNNLRKPLSFITERDIPKLVKILEDEDIKTISDVISSLDPALSARILPQLPDRTRDEVYPYLVTSRELTKKDIDALEDKIKYRMEGTLGGIEEFIKIIENAPVKDVESILESLDYSRPDLAAQIRSEIITFDDILKMESGEFVKLLSRARIEDIALIIQGSNEDIKNQFMSALPEESSSLVREWLDLMPIQPERNIDAAKKNFSTLAKQMEAAGEIMMNRS